MLGLSSISPISLSRFLRVSRELGEKSSFLGSKVTIKKLESPNSSSFSLYVFKAWSPSRTKASDDASSLKLEIPIEPVMANANTKTKYLKSGTHHPPGGQKYMGWFFYEKQSPLLSRRVGVVTLIDTKVHFDKILSADNLVTAWR